MNFRAIYQDYPFQHTTPRTVIVAAENRVEAYVAVCDYVMRQGAAPSVSFPAHRTGKLTPVHDLTESETAQFPGLGFTQAEAEEIVERIGATPCPSGKIRSLVPHRVQTLAVVQELCEA